MQRRTFLQTGLVGLLSARSPLLPPIPARPRGGPLRLNANENPLGMSPAARAALLDGLAEANRYPYPAHRDLVQALAEHHRVGQDQVVLGAGSSEVLQMAVQAFARSGATFVLAEPTFEDVPSYAEPWGLRLVRVPLRKDRAHDVQRMREATAAAKGPVVVYVCNPNNPTGTLTPAAELDDWIGAAAADVTFVVDEAYFEFADGAPGFASMQRWIDKRDNVIVTRTFSKVHGMAGLRLGYGLAHKDAAARLRALQSHNDCNHLALVAGRAALGDAAHVRTSLAENGKARALVCATLQELGLECMPSYANFVMHAITGELRDYIGRMRDAGILVGRPFPPLLGWSRLTLGTPAEMEQFCSTLRGFRAKGWV
jgi:histidinol-phosphate aminotransferase